MQQHMCMWKLAKPSSSWLKEYKCQKGRMESSRRQTLCCQIWSPDGQGITAFAEHLCRAMLCTCALALHGPVQIHSSRAFFSSTALKKQKNRADSCNPPSLLALPRAGWSNWHSNSQKAFCFFQTRFWDACWPSVLLFRRERWGSRGAFSLPSVLFQYSRWDFALQQSNLILHLERKWWLG